MKRIARIATAVAWLLPLAGAAACATPKPAEMPKKNPIVRPDPGKPVEVAILGARYTLSPRIDADDHRDEPGAFYLSYLDRVTRCMGFFLFETMSNAGMHEAAVQQRLDGLKATWAERGVGVSHRLEAQKVGDEEARVNVFEVAAADQTARAALLDKHFGPANLSVQAYVFCNDSGLVKAQLDAVAEVIASRK